MSLYSAYETVGSRQQRQADLHQNTPIGELILPRLNGHICHWNNTFDSGDGELQRVENDAFKLFNFKSPIGLRICHTESLIVPGVVRLGSDWEGIKCEIFLEDSQISRDLVLAIRHGFLTGLSPSWTYHSTTEEGADRLDYSRIYKVSEIHEISFTSTPGQKETFCGIGKVGLTAPSHFGPFLDSERVRLEKFINHVEFEANKIRPQPTLKSSLKSKPAAASKLNLKSAREFILDFAKEFIDGGLSSDGLQRVSSGGNLLGPR